MSPASPRNAIANFFIARPVFAVVLAIATLLAGVMGIYSLSISQYPDIAPVTVRVNATYNGATAEAVENSVTKKIESAMTGLDGLLLIALLAIGIVFARLYKRSTKETAFVRTGLGGQKVIMDGGAIVLPVFHERVLVNMNTLKLEVVRRDRESLITKDRMGVDVPLADLVPEDIKYVQEIRDSILEAQREASA